MSLVKGNTVTLRLNTGLDLTSYSVFEIGWEDPSQNQGVWSATVFGSPTDGVIETVQNLGEAGLWSVWSVVDGSKGQATVISVSEVPIDSQEQIVSLSFVKKYLGITTDDLDFTIQQLIPKIQQDYRRIRNAPFDRKYDSAGVPTGFSFPLGSEITATQMIGWTLKHNSIDTIEPLSSERIGSYSWTAAGSGSAVSGYPKSIIGSIERKVRFGDNYVGETDYTPLYLRVDSPIGYSHVGENPWA